MQDPKQPGGSRHSLQFSFSFSREDLRLDYTLFGVRPHLKGCNTTAGPGAPHLPVQVVRIALPAGAKVADIHAKPGETTEVVDAATPLAPIQPLRPGQQRKDAPPYSRPGEERWKPRRPARNGDTMRPTVEPWQQPAFVPPSEKDYQEAAGKPVAEMLAQQSRGGNSVISVALRPLRLTARGTVEFSESIELTVTYEAGQAGGAWQPASRAQALREEGLIRRSVINPDLVFRPERIYPYLNPEADYLIITDNQRWNADTITATGPVNGDMTAVFQRLAAWKRQRGVTARVVTISNIVGGLYGDFRTGCRDLQEVIRQFLKMAHRDWGVAWVLLGGDVDVVPIRTVASDKLGGIGRQTAESKPPANTSYWAGTFLKVHAKDPGVWWGAATTNRLMRQDTGMLIPYDATGSSSTTVRGWYFTTDDNYSTRSATPTDFVRVNGPASEINADLQFLYMWNSIPTDFYYASLTGPDYDTPGRHDWDLLDNGVYGQAWGGTQHDGLSYSADVSVGRAPAGTAAQADAFVSKVIAYEKFERPDGTPLDAEWPKRAALFSENWEWAVDIFPGAGAPPAAGQYHHAAGASHTVIRVDAVASPDWSLLARFSDTDQRIIPYRTDAEAAGRGWHFAVSDTDFTVPGFDVLVSVSPTLVTKRIPLPSPWIVVYGDETELTPSRYSLNQAALDGSLIDQETLREQWRADLPGLNVAHRLYQDLEDMTADQISGAPLERISATSVRAALNAGPHILSLSGHGSGWGCCSLTHTEADAATNGYHTFIVYADSCLTNQLDGDAMSEHLLRNPAGGAVAYVGNTRFSWIGLGDDYQRYFFSEWSRLAGNAHLGILHDSRTDLMESFWWGDSRWAVFALNLLGCPEMPLRWAEPLHILTEVPLLIEKFRIPIEPPIPCDPLAERPWREAWEVTTVHLRQGSRQRAMALAGGGVAEMSLDGFSAGPATVTLARPGHKPVVQEVRIAKQSSPEQKGLRLLGAVLAGLAIVSLLRAAFRKKRR